MNPGEVEDFSQNDKDSQKFKSGLYNETMRICSHGENDKDGTSQGSG